MKRNYFSLKTIWAGLCHLNLVNWIPDETFMKIEYYVAFRRKLNLKNPRRYSEKVEWLKLHDRKPQYTVMSDKYEAKKYIADRLGEQYVVPLLGVWDRFDDIDFDKLPNQFVLKVNHDSGGVVICRDKSKFDVAAARKRLERRLKHNYFCYCREWPYKNIKPRIIAEKYIEDEIGDLRDYKFFCYDGEVKIALLVEDRHTGEHTSFYYFDRDFKRLPISFGDPCLPNDPEKPKEFEEMVRLAEQLSVGIPHVRVDFYCVGGQIYFGEFTFYSSGGLFDEEDEKTSRMLGEYIHLWEV